MAIVPQEAFQFCGPTDVAASAVIDAQDSLNLYPEPQSGSAKSRMALIGRPGLAPTPLITLPASPVRQLWSGDNRMFAVGGKSFYEVSSTGTIIKSYGPMAASGGTRECRIIANGVQLLVHDLSVPAVFFAQDSVPDMLKVFDATALEYLDGFYFAIATGASLAGQNPNQINASDNGDGTVWNPLNYVLRTGSSDLTTQLAALNGQLWIFGEKTIEVWYNAGNAGFPLARISGATLNIGLYSPASVVKFSNTIVWVGADSNGSCQVYMTQGLNPVRISTFGIEYLLSQQPTGNAPFNSAYGYQEAGHTFYCLTIVDSAGLPTTSQVVYDLTTGLWHRRIYLPPALGGSSGAWPRCFTSLPYFGGNFIGDAFSGAIYKQSIQYPADGASQFILYQRTAPHVSNSNKWIAYPYFELDGDLGTSAPVLFYSNDGGRTFPNGPLVMQQAQDQGAPGTFRRFFARKLGRSRDRVFKVSITESANLVRIANAYIDIEPGDEQ